MNGAQAQKQIDKLKEELADLKENVARLQSVCDSQQRQIIQVSRGNQVNQ